MELSLTDPFFNTACWNGLPLVPIINSGSSLLSLSPHHVTITLVMLVRHRLYLTEAEANAKLLSRIPSGKRTNSKVPATIVAYRFLKRAISHFYENLGKAAVKSFVSSIKDITDKGKQLPVKGSTTRTVLTLT